MLKKLSRIKLIFLVIIISFVIAIIDLLFYDSFSSSFYVHNFFTLLAGPALALISYDLLRRGYGNNYVSLFGIFAGSMQFFIHLTLVIIGPCG